MTSDRQIAYEDDAPDGPWSVEIRAPGASSHAYYATFSDGTQRMGVPFGTGAPVDALTLDWRLPDSVLGVFLDGDCYLLFRWGPKRRRRRELSRVAPQEPFTVADIEWFCAEEHKQP